MLLPSQKAVIRQAVNVQGDEYAAAVDRMRNILGERQQAYSMADIQIPLETSPSDPGDVGAAPAIIAYR